MLLTEMNEANGYINSHCLQSLQLVTLRIKIDNVDVKKGGDGVEVWYNSFKRYLQKLFYFIFYD